MVLKVRLGVSTEYHYGNWNLTKSLKHKGIMRILKDTLVIVGIWLVIMLSTTQAMGLWSVVIH